MKWLSVLIGILIVGLGAWLLLQPQSASSPAPAQENEKGAMMRDDDTGASMETGTLEAGLSAEVTVDDGSSAQDEGESGATVAYTEDGFQPSTVTVSAGDTVEFVNTSSHDMWVAGDNHPTHTIYPEQSTNDCLGTAFDTCRTVPNGESWEFTFRHEGTWGYHNHVRARDAGTIVVE